MPALSSRLRTETKVAHTAAERSGVMRSLLRGTIDRVTYLALLQNLAAIYEAMESEIDKHRDDPAFAKMDIDALRRLPSLRHDIAILTQPNDKIDTIQPSTHEYVKHLHMLGEQNPSLIAAHAYLRYLGDLYGGQIIKGIVEKKLIAGSPNATTFYAFPKVGDTSAFKASFREAIDNIPEEQVCADCFVKEAQLGYEFHSRIFNEIQPTAT